MTNVATKACQSYRDRERICADGFVQTSICSGHGGCHACGHHTVVPWCQREDIPSRFLRDDGSPLFYRAGRAALEGK